MTWYELRLRSYEHHHNFFMVACAPPCPSPCMVEQHRRGQWHMIVLLAMLLPLISAARHPDYLRLRGGLDGNGLHAGGGAGTIEEEQREGDPEQPSGAVPSAPQQPKFGKPLARSAPLRLGRRRGVVRALKKGFGFIRMETLPGEPSPTDVYFDFAEQDAERIKRVKAGDKVLFALNHGPKRTLRGYGVTFDGGGAMESENTFTAHLRQVGLPVGLKGREPRKAMGPFAWGEESIRIYKERKAKRKAQRHGQVKTHDSEGFPIARAADALPLQSMTPAQLKSERMRRRASQRARRIDGGVLASGAGGASVAGDRLPQGWERRLDARGRPYYIDWNTLKSTWAPPPGYSESLAPAAGAARHPAADSHLPPLGEVDDLRLPFAAPLALAPILGSDYSNSSMAMILPELGMQIKGAGAQQLAVEDAGRKAARLLEIMTSVAQAPLAAGLRDAYSNGTLPDLMSSSEGLKSLHGMVLQDLSYVHDASWHALLRRLDNKSPEERRDWLRSKHVDMKLLYKSIAQMLLLLHTAAAASPSSTHSASGNASAPPDASPVLPAAAAHGGLAAAPAPDARVEAALAHMAMWGGREADSEQQSGGHGQKRCDIALTQGNVASGKELEGMVERLADADTDSEGGDDGLFFRPNAQTFQLPDEVKDTPLGRVLDKMRSEDFDHLQRVCSQPPSAKYFAHERAVNETFRRAIAAASDAEARAQEMEDAAVDELCQVEALARTHPRLCRWVRALMQGPDLIAHTEEAMSNFTRLSRACFDVDVASSSAKTAGAGTEAQYGGRGKGGEGDAWLHDLGETVVRELGPGAQIEEAAQVLAEASPMMARAIEEFNAIIRDNSTLHHALFFARAGSMTANASISSPHSSLLRSCMQGNSTRVVGAGPDEADGACPHRAHLMRLLAAGGAPVPAALAGFDDSDESETLRPFGGSRSGAGCPGRSLRKRLRSESWAGDSRDGGSVFLEEGGQSSNQDNGVGDVHRDDDGGDEDGLSSESSAARKRHCLGQAMQGKVRVDKQEGGDGVDARLAALSSGRREKDDAACREPDEQSADDELLSRLGWQTSSQKDAGKRLEETGNGGMCNLDGEEKGAREERHGDADCGTEVAGAGRERQASGQEADESSDACARLAREKRLWAKVGLGALVLTDDELLEPWSSSSRAEGGGKSSGGGEEQARDTTGLPARGEEVDLKLAYPACGVQAVHREHDEDVFHRNRRLWRAARVRRA